MAHKWAGLLASAAAGLDPNATHPSFPRILSEPTPHEAVTLDLLHAKGGEANWPSLKKELAKEFGCPEEALKASFWNLFRLGLWVHNISRSGGPDVLRLTDFGRAFLVVAHGPS